MKKIIVFLFALIFIFGAGACKKKNYLEDYISECRYNVMEGEAEGISVKVWQLTKESPYDLDGIRSETTALMEIQLYASDNTAEYTVFFDDSGKNYGGELSYNSVKKRHDASFPYPVKHLETVDLAVSFGKTTIIIKAQSVIKEEILSPSNALAQLRVSQKERFDSFGKNGSFEGEIHIRLLEESGKCYYYVGLINKTGKIYAYLIDAATAEVIAEKEINYRTNLAP